MVGEVNSCGVSRVLDSPVTIGFSTRNVPGSRGTGSLDDNSFGGNLALGDRIGCLTATFSGCFRTAERELRFRRARRGLLQGTFVDNANILCAC